MNSDIEHTRQVFKKMKEDKLKLIDYLLKSTTMNRFEGARYYADNCYWGMKSKFLENRFRISRSTAIRILKEYGYEYGVLSKLWRKPIVWFDEIAD